MTRYCPGGIMVIIDDGYILCDSQSKNECITNMQQAYHLTLFSGRPHLSLLMRR